MTTTTPRRRRLLPVDQQEWRDAPDRPRLRGIAYARQSEDDSDGIERQLEDIQLMADRENIEIVRSITENDQSASKNKPRPGYDGELLPAIEAGEAEVILAQTQDRLLRKPIEMEHLIDLVEKTGTKVMLYRSRIDLTDANGRAAARQAAVWARLEVEQKAERRVRAEQQRARRGQPPGRRAFGYTQSGMETKPEEAALVRAAFDRLFRGDTITSIVAMFNEAGLPTAWGSPTWNRRGVTHVLRNPRYAAIRTYYGDEVCAGIWPALITREEHERAAALLDDPSRRTTPGNKRRHLGTGLYLCGVCEDNGEDPDTIRITSPSNRRGTAKAYTCKTFHHMSRRAESVDKVVLAMVEKLLSREGAGELLTHDLPDLAPLRAESDAIKAKIARAQRDYDDEKIDADDLRRVKVRRMAELEVVERKIATAARKSRLAQLAHSPDPWAAFQAADVDMKREVIDALMQVVLRRGRPGRVPGGGYFDPETVELRPRQH